MFLQRTQYFLQEILPVLVFPSIIAEHGANVFPVFYVLYLTVVPAQTFTIDCKVKTTSRKCKSQSLFVCDFAMLYHEVIFM